MNVIIVGAGVVGCAVAYELSRRGAMVSIVDPRGVGCGATHASAGILAPRIEGHSAELLHLTEASLVLYDGFVDDLRGGASGHPVEYERAGTLQVAVCADEVAPLAEAAERLRAGGIDHVFATGPSAAAGEPALTRQTAATLFLPQHGYIAVGALTHALSEAAAKRGGRFITARATEIRGTRVGVEVVTDAGLMGADAVIVAAGSWSDDLAAGALRPSTVRPIRGQLLRLRAQDRAASRVIWGSRCYIVPWRDGRVLVGATVEDVGFDERATAGGVRQLLDAAVELLPALSTASFEAVRVGLRPMTRDELPVIGASSTSPRVFYATGHYRNGVLLAPLTSVLVADLVLAGKAGDELAFTRPSRLGL